MQNDSNIVTCKIGGIPIWSTNTAGTLEWMTVLIAGRSACHGPDPDQSSYGAASPRRRSIAIVVTIALHFVIAALLLSSFNADSGSVAERVSNNEPSIFAVTDTNGIHASVSVTRTSKPVVPTTTVPEQITAKSDTPAKPSGSDAILPPGSPAGQFSDPFAVAGLPNAVAAPGDAMVTMTAIRSTLPDLDQQALAALIGRLHESLPDLNGTAILRASIAVDGRVIEASFLGGSIDDGNGAQLAHMLVGQLLYPPINTATIRTALLGPIILTPPIGAAS